MKFFFISLAFVALIVFGASCSDNDSSTQMNDAKSQELVTGFSQGVGNALARGINLDKQIDLSYTTQEERDSLVNSLINETFEVELKLYPDSGSGQMSDEFSVEILDNGLGNLNVTPHYSTLPVTVNSSDSGDKDRGEGEGWKNYGTSSSEKKIKEYSEMVANELKPNLAGKCLDIRIKRNLISATVCARVIDCVQ